MKQIGIIIVVIGLLVTIFTGFNLVTKKKLVNVGDFQVTTNQNHRVAWSPIIGVAFMAIGGGIYFIGKRKA